MAYTTKREIFDQTNTWMLDLTRQILTQIEYHTRSIREKLEAEIGPFNDSDVNLAKIAIGMEPEPFGLAHIYQCIPYANPKLFHRDFEGAIQRGWLTVTNDGTYRATQKGQEFHHRMNQEIRNVYSNLHPLPMMQMERLNRILREIVTSIEHSNILFYKPAFDMELKLTSHAQSILQKVCCKLTHLMAYRDDAYLNAWMEQEVNSYVWEAFSYIYKGQAQTVKSLAKKLEVQRLYDENAYAEALEELVTRNWIIYYQGKYEPTTAGLKILAEVARKMTQYFFKPWLNLDEVKIDHLQTLMEALLKGLQSPQTKRWLGQTSSSRNFSWRTTQWVRDKVR